MTTKTTDLPAIVERLERLERQNRRIKQAGAVALILAAGALLMGQASPRPGPVEGSVFILKDAQFRVRARLGVYKDSPTLDLYDVSGAPRLTASVSNGGSPSLSLWDASGAARLSVNLSDDGSPSVHLWNAKGKRLAELSLVGHPTLSLRYPNGNGGLSLEAQPDGSGLWMYGPDGMHVILNDGPGGPDKVLAAQFNDDGKLTGITAWRLPPGPALALWDHDGYAAAVGVGKLQNPTTGETRQTSAASVVLFGKDRGVLWQAP